MRLSRTGPVLGAAFDQGGHFPTIAVVNQATVPLGPYTLAQLVAAMQECFDLHFVAVWGYPVKFVIYDRVEDIPADQWPFLFIDDADSPGAEGYHDLTKNGQPVSKVFVKTTLQAGDLVSVTASHEAYEVAIDPGAQLWAQKDSKTMLAYETADPVEEDTFEVQGIAMSNFVYPSWFENWKHPAGTKYDHLALLKAPFTMTKGGYMIVMHGGKVTQKFGSAAKAKRFAKEDRRGHRNEIGRMR